MQPSQTTPQVDPTALALTRAIRSVETNPEGNYTAMGDNDTSSGAYQWNNGKTKLNQGEIPANFQAAAKQFGLDPTDFSPTNQDHVAYEQVKTLLDSGKSQSEVAAIWNGHRVVNGKDEAINPEYVRKVEEAYSRANLPGIGALGSAVQSANQSPIPKVAGDSVSPEAPPQTMNATGSDVIPQSGGMLSNIKKNLSEVPGDVMKVANKIGNTVAPNEVNTLGSAMAGIGNIPAQEKGFISSPSIGGQAKGLGELGKVAAIGAGTNLAAEEGPMAAKAAASKVADFAAEHPKVVGLLKFIGKKAIGGTAFATALEAALHVKGLLGD